MNLTILPRAVAFIVSLVFVVIIAACGNGPEGLESKAVDDESVIADSETVRVEPKRTEIYVIRHGEYKADEGTLTERGRGQILKMLEQLKLEKVDKILYSSVRRTKESAEIVKKYYGDKAEFEESDKLNYKLSNAEEIVDLIREVMAYDEKKIVFMVTHSPKMEAVVEHYNLKNNIINYAEVISITEEDGEVKANYFKMR